MTFKELEIFYALSEESHVSNLAKKLNLSQSAISLSIKSLEKKLGENLFDRVGKKLILNERGIFFKNSSYMEYINLKKAQELFKKDKISGKLKISASRTIGDYIMPKIVFDFLQKYPNVSIETETQNSKNITEELLNGDISLGFIEADISTKDLIFEKIGLDELIIVSKDKNLSKRKYFIDELFDRVWIFREKGSGTREFFVNIMGHLLDNIDNSIELSGFEGIKTLLLHDKKTITCISRICVENELKRGELYEVKLKNLSFIRSFFIIYHKNKYQNRLFLEFKNFSILYFKHSLIEN